MTASRTRFARLAVGLIVFAVGFGGAALLDSTLLALAGSVGLIVALLTVGWPRGRAR